MNNNPLLTPKALQLSLTAPRCPPYNTAQRCRMMGLVPVTNVHPYVTTTTTMMNNSDSSPSTIIQQQHHYHQQQSQQDDNTSTYGHHDRKSYHHLIHRFLYGQQQQKQQKQKQQKHRSNHNNSNYGTSNHPHIMTVGPPDISTWVTRLFGTTIIPTSWQNTFRDEGTFRTICDNLVTITIPFVALSNPYATMNFVSLSYGYGTISSCCTSNASTTTTIVQHEELQDDNNNIHHDHHENNNNKNGDDSDIRPSIPTDGTMPSQQRRRRQSDGIQQRQRIRIRRKRLVYGTDDPNVQFIDVFIPEPTHHHSSSSSKTVVDTDNPNLVVSHHHRGMVLFIHGGAWGSGRPWFYRLVALPFVRMNLIVAIVGYRVYPLSAHVNDQVNDIDEAYNRLCKEYPTLCGPQRHHEQQQYHYHHHHSSNPFSNKQRWIGTVVIGHSSGAHIGLLWVMERVKRMVHQTKLAIGPSERNTHRTPQEEEQQQQSVDGMSEGIHRQRYRQRHRHRQPFVDAFVGISGPYNIDHHFDYEAARGVEEISPLKAANGYTREAFQQNSPAHRLYTLVSKLDETDYDRHNKMGLDYYFPNILLVHGIEDETVPFTATGEMGRSFRSCGLTHCDELYVPKTGHQDAVVHLMLGGPVEEMIVHWLETTRPPQDIASVVPRSRL